MSNEEEKFNHSKRLHKDEAASKRQMRIAKAYKMHEGIDSPHRFVKKHAMNCGNPKCNLCANPRKMWKEKTFQEKKQEQSIEVEE